MSKLAAKHWCTKTQFVSKCWCTKAYFGRLREMTHISTKLLNIKRLSQRRRKRVLVDMVSLQKKMKFHCSSKGVDVRINGRSYLSRLVNFNIIECLTHDPMHVLLEGLIPYEMALSFHHCIDSKKYFTLIKLWKIS